MNFQSEHKPASPSTSLFPSARPPVAVDAVVLRHLKTRQQIEAVLHLREEIDLSAHSGAGANFGGLEKKETRSVSSVLSSLKTGQ